MAVPGTAQQPRPIGSTLPSVDAVVVDRDRDESAPEHEWIDVRRGENEGVLPPMPGIDDLGQAVPSNRGSVTDARQGTYVDRGAATQPPGSAAAQARAFESRSPHRGKYVVRDGDTLSGIAARNGISWQEIYAVNQDVIDDPNVIVPGMKLDVPRPGEVGVHTVVAGDTLGDIAWANGTTATALWRMNEAQISDPDVIVPGMVLLVRDDRVVDRQRDDDQPGPDSSRPPASAQPPAGPPSTPYPEIPDDSSSIGTSRTDAPLGDAPPLPPWQDLPPTT